MSVSTVAVPTPAQIRAFYAFSGTPLKGSKVTSVQIADFLYAQPATARALAAQVGAPMGKRGRLSPESVGAVVSLIEAQA